jgi:hypothetical protein
MDGILTSTENEVSSFNDSVGQLATCSGQFCDAVHSAIVHKEICEVREENVHTAGIFVVLLMLVYCWWE